MRKKKIIKNWRNKAVGHILALLFVQPNSIECNQQRRSTIIVVFSRVNPQQCELFVIVVSRPQRWRFVQRIEKVVQPTFRHKLLIVLSESFPFFIEIIQIVRLQLFPIIFDGCRLFVELESDHKHYIQQYGEWNVQKWEQINGRNTAILYRYLFQNTVPAGCSA